MKGMHVLVRICLKCSMRSCTKPEHSYLWLSNISFKVHGESQSKYEMHKDQTLELGITLQDTCRSFKSNPESGNVMSFDHIIDKNILPSRTLLLAYLITKVVFRIKIESEKICIFSLLLGTRKARGIINFDRE